MYIHIALGTDDKYAPYAGAVMASAIAHAGPADLLAFHILTFGLSDDSARKLRELCADTPHCLQLHIAAADDCAAFPPTVHTRNSYLRLLTPKLLADLDKVLYLDADIVVLRSLRTLWDTDIEGVALAATPDAQHFFRGIALDYWRSIALPPNAVYFNAGVLLMNLPYWREHRLLDRVGDWLRNNGAMAVNTDQTALNAVVPPGEVKLLAAHWNVQAPLLSAIMHGWKVDGPTEQAARAPGIVHFTTLRKPWRRELSIPYATAFRRHLAATPWGSSACPAITASDVSTRLYEETRHVWRCLRYGLRFWLGRSLHKLAPAGDSP